VSISFKQSKHALNIDSNGHQKIFKKHKNVLKEQKQLKNMFFTSLEETVRFRWRSRWRYVRVRV